MTYAHQRRLRGARFLNGIAAILWNKELRRPDSKPFKIMHPEITEFDALCDRLARQISQEAANFRRRK